MNDILIQLSKYQQKEFTKKIGPPLEPNDYDCPDSVKQTFHELNKSTVYEWGSNQITFYYTDEHCDRLFHYVARMLHVIQPKDKPITAIIILSSATKYYPEDGIFDQNHVNTGYANDKHIVIYRNVFSPNVTGPRVEAMIAKGDR